VNDILKKHLANKQSKSKSISSEDDEESTPTPTRATSTVSREDVVKLVETSE